MITSPEATVVAWKPAVQWLPFDAFLSHLIFKFYWVSISKVYSVEFMGMNYICLYEWTNLFLKKDKLIEVEKVLL